MPYKMKPCAHPDCATMIYGNCTFCRKHVDWRAVSKVPTSYNVERICKECGKPFNIGHSVQKVCDDCRTIECPVCGKSFVRHDQSRRTCSEECSAVYNAAPMRTCRWCGKQFKQRNGHNTKFCCKECRYLGARRFKDTAKARHKSSDYRKWRWAVIRRDNYTCQRCGATEKLHAHHIERWTDRPDLAFDVSNGLTLCRACHIKEHGGMPIINAGTRKRFCDNCGTVISGRGKSALCRSCAMKQSPKVKAAQVNRKRNVSGHFV